MKGDNHDRYSLLTMNAGKEALIRKKIKLLQQTKTPLRPPSWIEDSSLRMLSIGYLLSSADQCVLQSHILFKMASSNRVTNTSLSLTLPISCQICLGKVNLSNLDTRQLSRVVLFDSQLFVVFYQVKEPVVCPNQHVFCSPCLDLWLRSNHYCPTCRTPITHDQPCKKILGKQDLCFRDLEQVM